jgi:hypothetical protein
MTEDGRQMTEVRGQMTEDGRQMTEVRCRKADSRDQIIEGGSGNYLNL